MKHIKKIYGMVTIHHRAPVEKLPRENAVDVCLMAGLRGRGLLHDSN